MTEEEKKAIKIVKEIWQFTDYSTDKIALKVVLDLIKKLQKENEELRVQGSIILLDYNILKDKIRKKIEELENGEQCYYEFSTVDLVDLLKILLEEE